MLARWQRFFAITTLLLALTWLGWCHSASVPWWGAGLGLLVAIVPHALFLALEFVLLAWWGRDDAAPHASVAQLVRAWAGEVRAAWITFGWRQPFASQRVPDVTGEPGRTGVLLLHGYFCNRGLWSPWLQHWRAQGVPCMALTQEPVFGSIDDWVPGIEAAVQALTLRTGRQPVIVAHSMGGLATRAWLAWRRRQAPGGPAPVQRVITVGTPHHGTWLARWGHTTNARQMRRGSTWLRSLAAVEAQQPSGVPFTCFFGHADNIVFPASTATLEGADNRHLPGVAHVQMVFAPEVLAETGRVLRQLDAARA
jgi:pimeloyl-ACP methyl ester carboxylesterase